MRLRRRRAIPACALALSLGAGCATPLQPLGVVSEPPGAEVYVDGAPAGTTPLELALPPAADHSVYLKKDGYRPELVVLSPNRGPDGVEFLTPADVRVRLVPLADPRGREVEIEVEE